MTAHAVPPFSIVLIARNEAHTLPRLARTLARFRKRGGDVVLLDTGSTDATVRVAKAAGFRVVRAGNKFHSKLTRTHAEEINATFAQGDEGPLVRAGTRLFHFGEARQAAAELAAHGLVLHVDASDTIRALDLDFWDEAISAGAARRFSYWKEYVSTTKPADVLSYRLTWFYDRRSWRWEGRCHEALVANDKDADAARTMECTREQLLVRHTKEEGKARHSYLPGLALDALEQPENPRRQHYLGRELYYAHHYRSALELLERHAAVAVGWIPERAESLCLAGACYDAVGEPTAAAQAYERAFALDGTRREPLLRLAERAQAHGDFEGCAHYASAALRIPRTSAYFERDANYTYAPHALLYWALFWLGRKAEAKKHWEQCRTLFPMNKRFRGDAKLFG